MIFGDVTNQLQCKFAELMPAIGRELKEVYSAPTCIQSPVI
jgi:hypothetical protein